MACSALIQFVQTSVALSLAALEFQVNASELHRVFKRSVLVSMEQLKPG